MKPYRILPRNGRTPCYLVTVPVLILWTLFKANETLGMAELVTVLISWNTVENEWNPRNGRTRCRSMPAWPSSSWSTRAASSHTPWRITLCASPTRLSSFSTECAQTMCSSTQVSRIFGARALLMSPEFILIPVPCAREHCAQALRLAVFLVRTRY
jgi:hypothetical protein